MRLPYGLELDDITAYQAGTAAAAAILATLVTRLFYRRFLCRNTMSVTIKWNRDKLHVPLDSPDATLGDLRSAVAQLTSLDPTSFKLIFAGAQMKDDAASLSAYSVRPGSTVVLVGGGGAPPGPPERVLSAKEREKERLRTEEGTITVIREELGKIDRLRPALDTFLALIRPAGTPPAEVPDVPESVAAPASTSAGIPQPTAEPIVDVDTEHRRLAEEFLQVLLRLDTLTLDGSWTSARTERKGAIKSVQQLLDQLDSGWRERSQTVQ